MLHVPPLLHPSSIRKHSLLEIFDSGAIYCTMTFGSIYKQGREFMLSRHKSLCLSSSAAALLLAGPEDPAYIKYQAESPDEAALVAAGKAFGFFFHRRNHTSVLVREPRGDAEVECEYEILNILEFDSTRKRMSVICRNPEGNIMLYCKVRCPASHCQRSCCTLPVTCPTPVLPVLSF